MSIMTDYNLRFLREKRAGKRVYSNAQQFQNTMSTMAATYADKLLGKRRIGANSIGTTTAANEDLLRTQSAELSQQYGNNLQREEQKQEQIRAQENIQEIAKAQEEAAKREQEKARKDNVLKTVLKVGGALAAPVTGGLSVPASELAAGFVGGGGDMALNYANPEELMQGALDTIQGVSAVTSLGEHKETFSNLSSFIQSPEFNALTSDDKSNFAELLMTGNKDLIYTAMNKYLPKEKQFIPNNSWNNFLRGF